MKGHRKIIITTLNRFDFLNCESQQNENFLAGSAIFFCEVSDPDVTTCDVDAKAFARPILFSSFCRTSNTIRSWGIFHLLFHYSLYLSLVRCSLIAWKDVTRRQQSNRESKIDFTKKIFVLLQTTTKWFLDFETSRDDGTNKFLSSRFINRQLSIVESAK